MYDTSEVAKGTCKITKNQKNTGHAWREKGEKTHTICSGGEKEQTYSFIWLEIKAHGPYVALTYRLAYHALTYRLACHALPSERERPRA